MEDYVSYLSKLDYSTRTIETNLYYVAKLQKWSKTKKTRVENLSYRQLLNFIQHLKTSHKPKTINCIISNLKHYFNYLVEEGYCTENLIEDLKIRGERKKILHNLLSSDELEDLFHSYQTERKTSNYYFKATAKRNKVIVGLLVYQGLVSNNFRTLKIEHLDLHRGTIYIPSTRRNNSRKLQLKSSQILLFKEYMDGVLPVLQNHMNIYDESLFPLNTEQFGVILNPIFKKLKQYNNLVFNNQSIRSSVIVNWLKQYNIRKAQQMAGHRHISSTESYKQDNIVGLQGAIDQFHPLN